MEPVCIRVVLDAKITDHLHEKPKGLHIDQLGRLTDQDPRKLGRILRTLATNHVYTEGQLFLQRNRRNLTQRKTQWRLMFSLITAFP